jgi:uncharacterized protein (TIGR02996 family)
VSDRDAILRAILDSPHEDAPRLVYADWLDERSESLRAEFIRLQCELERRGGPAPGREELLLRERELWGRAVGTRAAFGWFPGLPGCEQLLSLTPPATVSWGLGGGRQLKGVVRRGFVAHVDCNAADWLGHGPALAADHPVVNVTLEGKEPSRGLGRGERADWIWYGGGDAPAALPEPIWRAYVQLTSKIPGRGRHPSRDEAMIWLSGACLAWARAEVGVARPLKVW